MSNQRIRQPLQTDEDIAAGYAKIKTPNSARSYTTDQSTNTTLVPAGLYPQQSFFDRDGNEIVLVKGRRPGTIPARASAQNTTADHRVAPGAAKQGIHLTKERVIGILLSGMALALLLMLGVVTVSNWWTGLQQDWTYTASFRTYSVDQAVGHNGDSPQHPSHFIIQNDKGHVVVIELPANDPKQAKIFTATTLIGADREPVTVTFADTTGSGHLDLILHVQGQEIVCRNDGAKFNPPTG